MADTEPITERFRAARGDPELAVLEGFHAVKHALRFGAELLEVAIRNEQEVKRLAEELAPDVAEPLLAAAGGAHGRLFDALAPRPPDTGVVAIARRPRPTEALGEGRVVLLENPRHLGNLGACIRVAAAADAAGVLTTGTQDPWHPDAIRGAAGLHYALPVARVERLPELERPLIAVDPSGAAGTVPDHAVLAFGTERHGLSREIRERADAVLRIPMREGVSSLNLATAVAAVLFARRL